LISRINVRVRWLRRKFSRAHWAARLFGLPLPKGETLEPGLIILQLDGLSRKHLEKAMHEGRMPFLSKLVLRRHFTLETFYSGVPSTTPAVQAEIFFGIKTAVPSFHFLERKSGKIRRMYEAESSTEVEASLMEQCPNPLLQGAHAYSDIYVAGAAESRYCARDLCATEIFRRMNPLKSLALAVLYSVKILRLIGLGLLEIIIALVDVFRGLYEREDFIKEVLFVPARVCIGSVVRELIRFRILIDVERGTRLIHANFLGYDEQAHRRGPGSKFAYWSLKGLDRTVRDIYLAAHRSSYRDYEMIVYSDHGQEHAAPYEKLHERELSVAVTEVFSTGPTAEFPLWMQKMPTIVGNTLDRCRALLRLPPKPDGTAATCDPSTQIILTAMGPVGHIYLPLRLTHEHTLHYARNLVHEAHVPLVIIPGRGEDLLAINKRGEWKLPEDAAAVIGKEHPFLEEATEDLMRLARHPDAGEFVLCGWDPEGRPVSFPMENGAHGGPGSEETRGFILTPDAIQRACHSGLPERPGRIRGTDLKQMAEAYLQRDTTSSPPFSRNHPTRESTSLRILTYNVHSCRGLDGKVRPERIARVINQFDPDVVALQELDAHRSRSGRHDQAREIARHLDMEHVFYDMLDEEEEKYGIAVFARFQFETRRMAILSPAKPGLREARGAIHLFFPAAGERPGFHLINTHFGLGRQERRDQATCLLGEEWLGGIPESEPAILCGDFNSSATSWVWRKLHHRLRDAQASLVSQKPLATFSSIRPFLRIDHVFASRHFEAKAIEVGSNPTARIASDHLPLCIAYTFRHERST
jgi:endonuclease/exonuclease/phosphatase family metal-dependent hydrolase